MGHLRQDLADEPLRFWAVYSYLIIYREDSDPLEMCAFCTEREMSRVCCSETCPPQRQRS